MAKWALGIRLPGSTLVEIERALHSGAILRTHLLRPTWHLVARPDIRWLLRLTGPRIKARLRARHRHLGLGPVEMRKSRRIIEKALARSGPLPRAELSRHLAEVGFDNDDNRHAHLLVYAELDEVIASGPTRDGQPTYALLDERAPQAPKREEAEALGMLAVRFFQSHGPATLADLCWWAGLSVPDGRKALDAAGRALLRQDIGGATYWTADAPVGESSGAPPLLFLPAFDELVIAYKDRSALMPPSKKGATIARGGVFYPTVVDNGRIIGLWKRTVTGPAVTIDVELGTARPARRRLTATASAYAGFLEKKLVWAEASGSRAAVSR